MAGGLLEGKLRSRLLNTLEGVSPLTFMLSSVLYLVQYEFFEETVALECYFFVRDYKKNSVLT